MQSIFILNERQICSKWRFICVCEKSCSIQPDLFSIRYSITLTSFLCFRDPCVQQLAVLLQARFRSVWSLTQCSLTAKCTQILSCVGTMSNSKRCQRIITSRYHLTVEYRYKARKFDVGEFWLICSKNWNRSFAWDT